MEVQRHYEESRSWVADVGASGQGSGEEAAGFCRMLKTGYPCLGDPGKDAYREFQLSRDSWWNVTAKPFLEEPKLAFDRIRNASLKGSLMKHTDVLQLGGVVIVDRGGIIRYLHRSAKTDDLPDTRDLLAVLDRMAAPL